MEKGLKLNRNQLKYVLIAAMLIDHIAWSFVPTSSALGQIMHFIGRLTGPAMAVLLAEGYQYTRDKKKYAIRLFIFALISWVPYALKEHGSWPYIGQSVIYTLFIAFMTIWMWDSLKIKKHFKIMLVVIACIFSMIGDWAFFAVLWALFSYIYRDDPRKKWTSFGLVAALEVSLSFMFPLISGGNPLTQSFQLGVVLVPLLMIFCYSGKPGSKAAIHKWFFYIFYPAHMLLIYLLKLWIYKG